MREHERPLEVLVQRRLRPGLVVVRGRLVEDLPVAGLLHVGRDREDQPERVVVEPRSDRVVPSLRERLVLVVGAARRQLRRRQVEDPFARPLGHHVHEAEEVLARIAESDAASDPRVERRGGPGQVERRHALVRVPDVHHPVDVFVGRGDLHDVELLGPSISQALERGVDLVTAPVAVDHREDGPAVEGRRSRRVELRLRRVLPVAEQEDDLPCLVRRQLDLHLVRGDRRPAAGDRVPRSPVLHHRGPIPAAVGPQELLPLRVEPGNVSRAREVGEVVPPLPILGRVVDHPVQHLHLAGREVPLVVRLVVPGVPEAELHRPDQREHRRLGAVVGDPRPPDLERLPEGNEVEALRLDPPRSGSRSPCTRARGGTGSPPARSAPAATRATRRRRSRRHGGTGSGRPCRPVPRRSGTA